MPPHCAPPALQFEPNDDDDDCGVKDDDDDGDCLLALPFWPEAPKQCFSSKPQIARRFPFNIFSSGFLVSGKKMAQPASKLIDSADKFAQPRFPTHFFAR